MVKLGGTLKKYTNYIVGGVLVLLLLGFLIFRGFFTQKIEEEVILLDGLETPEVLIVETWTGAEEGEEKEDVVVVREKKDTDTWRVDAGSRVYWSIGKQGGAEGHNGNIEAQGLLFSLREDKDKLTIVTGRSHITFLMPTFDVDNIPNDGVKSLFLNHLHSDDFLDSDVYPFAQFVIDRMIEEVQQKEVVVDGMIDVIEHSAWVIDGRLKIKDVIETVSLTDVQLVRQGDGVLFFTGELELSRYLWGLDAMPGVIDEFITIEFDLGLSIL